MLYQVQAKLVVCGTHICMQYICTRARQIIGFTDYFNRLICIGIPDIGISIIGIVRLKFDNLYQNKFKSFADKMNILKIDIS
jgi:hypothetical protein